MATNTENTNTEKRAFAFSALNPYTEINIPEPTEIATKGKEIIQFGDDNAYPSFIYSLYEDCATLQAIVNGTTDYITGDDIHCTDPKWEKEVNKTGETLADLIGKCANDYLVFGGFYLDVERNAEGVITELYWLDYRYVRSDKNNECFYYSEEWDAKSFGRVNYVKYPKFVPEFKGNLSSIFYFKSPGSRGTYATPEWQAAIKYALIDTKIAGFHLNEIENNFTSSVMINFNNGVPSEAEQEEIENNINEKFSGNENSGRILISFADDKDHQTEVVRIASDDFDERYTELAKRTREQIFVGFRAIPALFGLMTETTGFSTQEFQEAFKLYNKTCVKPRQNKIITSIEKIIGLPGSIKITPFTLDTDDLHKD